MANNQYVNKVVFGSATLVDLTGTTATADKILQGYGAYGADGAWMDGTAVAGSGSAVSITDTTDANGGTIRTITAVSLAGDTVTADKLLSGYTAHNSLGEAITGTYVPSGASKNTQIVQSTTRTNSSTLTAIGAELTVSKSGQYDIYYACFRTNTSSSYTWGTRLYIDGTAQGTENTTWTNNQQNTHLTNVSLTSGQKLRVYGRETRGTSYYVCAPMLAIVEV